LDPRDRQHARLRTKRPVRATEHPGLDGVLLGRDVDEPPDHRDVVDAGGDHELVIDIDVEQPRDGGRR
jgi:hypothetical protein